MAWRLFVEQANLPLDRAESVLNRLALGLLLDLQDRDVLVQVSDPAFQGMDDAVSGREGRYDQADYFHPVVFLHLPQFM